MRTVVSVVLAAAVVFGSVVTGAFIMRSAIDEQPMPCGEHEVYVWVDYPDAAQCVDDTDHQHHGGM